MSVAGPGQGACDERRAPVRCLQDVQWQEEAFSGREEGASGGVVKVWGWARQRHWALRVITAIFRLACELLVAGLW